MPGAASRARPETFPRKEKKAEGKLRRGAAFVAVRADGMLLMRTRAPKGLLGGMAEAPGSEWRADYDVGGAISDAPLAGNWQARPGVVEHVFTHFPLQLTVFVAEIPAGTPAPGDCRWVALGDVDGEALPNVMRKVIAHGLGR